MEANVPCFDGSLLIIYIYISKYSWAQVDTVDG